VGANHCKNEAIIPRLKKKAKAEAIPEKGKNVASDRKKRDEEIRPRKDILREKTGSC